MFSHEFRWYVIHRKDRETLVSTWQQQEEAKQQQAVTSACHLYLFGAVVSSNKASSLFYRVSAPSLSTAPLST